MAESKVVTTISDGKTYIANARTYHARMYRAGGVTMQNVHIGKLHSNPACGNLLQGRSQERGYKVVQVVIAGTIVDHLEKCRVCCGS